ncbi:hypothetical protein [Roseateles saccharophilus]|uniref:Extracellular solute-binding protein (Family 3) n=1 Tax=Roseateles saccharophilus TaxID=304 RepID=A0A4R3V9J7_ROSSA|nr:hypothetical protein [Roseateles saccharophilus]MDG0835020.1 hypothetical protein [Roseateles saccharophilus]TCV00393.1 hypothetical protein EV671_1008148 [Roseateles saccharophilus]
MQRRSLLTLSLLPAARCAIAQPAEAVRLPRHISMPDPQLPYVERLVALALARAGSHRRVQLVELEMAQGRSFVELGSGRSPFDLMWTVTDRQRETAGPIPVRIPIDRGLMGWRLLLVRASDLARWRDIGTLDALRGLTAGQGHDWPDTAILRANGLQVATTSGYDALFRMLAAGRFDYFPRSILEIDAELTGNRHPQLALVPQLMLHYPAAAYLFVNPRRPELADELRRGLDAAVADGSFQQLHHAQFGALVRAHPIAREHVLRLANPLLPVETPLQRRELWLQPGEG